MNLGLRQRFSYLGFPIQSRGYCYPMAPFKHGKIRLQYELKRCGIIPRSVELFFFVFFVMKKWINAVRCEKFRDKIKKSSQVNNEEKSRYKNQIKQGIIGGS